MRKFSFECFLSELPSIWESKTERHIATHTAPVWGDITDDNGKLLVDEIFKLENINDAVSAINQKLGLSIKHFSHINKGRDGEGYRGFFNRKSRKLVEQLYGDDIKNLHYDF